MKANEKQIWFPAKKYGWGWGPPRAWQGWVVIVVFAGSVAAAGIFLLPGKHFVLWGMAIAASLTALIAICHAKGETPRWRWGESDKPQVESVSERLAELDKLHRRQLISESEYQAKRQEILKGL